MEEVLDAAAGARLAIEINGDPHRLGLQPEWAREAKRRDLRFVIFVISTDAHSMGGIRNLRYGIGIARRAGLSRSEVLTTLDARAFKRAVAPSGH